MPDIYFFVLTAVSQEQSVCFSVPKINCCMYASIHSDIKLPQLN